METGSRKLIYCSVFSTIVLGIVSVIKATGGALNLFECIIFAIVILGFPLLNTISKLFNELLSKRVMQTVSKFADTFKKIGGE